MKFVLLATVTAAALQMASCQSTGADKSANGQAPAATSTEVASPAPAARAGVQHVDAATFAELMKQPNTVVLDVRTPAEIAARKIEGSVEMDISRPDFAERVAGLDKTKTYLVYCRSGSRSRNACQYMANQGFENLYNLNQGINSWPQ